MDPYALCPCGSGKKMKFCCQAIIGEMEKVERLQENNQPRMALQLLERLRKTHPDNPWIVTRTALSLIDDDRPAEAESALRPFLRVHRDHPLANVLYGLSVFNRDGYPEAKRAVHRAFRLGTGQFPEIVASLASSIAAGYLADAQYLAARQHMAFSLRLGSADQRKRAFSALLEFDGDQSVPYPLRGPHELPEYEAPEAHREQAQRAHQFSQFACWKEAADALTEAVEQGGESAEAWHRIGIFRASDGDEESAAVALHRAAEMHEDFETAVECETLAQLFEQYGPERTQKMRARRFRVESASRLLSTLDEVGQFARVDRPESDGDGETVARYLILDRDSEPSPDGLLRSETPRYLARMAVFDSSEPDELSAQVFLSALEGEPLDSAVAALRAAAGELVTIEPPSESGDDEAVVTGMVPSEQVALFQNYYFPPRTPGKTRRRIQQEEWDEVVFERWPNTALAALGGRTPVEAAGDESMRVALCAAIRVLDTYCSIRSYIFPEAELCERIGVPVHERLQVADDTNLNVLSLMQLRRVNPESLDSKQLEQVVHRALLARHPAHACDVIRTVIDRGLAAELKADAGSLCAAASEMCRTSLRQDEAFAWVERGKAAAEQSEEPFEGVLQWKMRELTLRLDDPEDPKLQDLLRELWERYGSKLPWLRGQLTKLVAELEIDPPWEGVVVAGSMPESAGETDSSTEGGEKKLWLPGDD